MADSSVSNGLPHPQGLYDPGYGNTMLAASAFVADIKGRKSHEIITQGIQILMNLTHRGACGCDSETGDGAGLLVQIPACVLPSRMPEPRLPACRQRLVNTGSEWFSFQSNCSSGSSAKVSLSALRAKKVLPCLAGAILPTDGDAIGRVARNSQPYIQQIFLGPRKFEAGWRCAGTQALRGQKADRESRSRSPT